MRFRPPDGTVIAAAISKQFADYFISHLFNLFFILVLFAGHRAHTVYVGVHVPGGRRHSQRRRKHHHKDGGGSIGDNKQPEVERPGEMFMIKCTCWYGACKLNKKPLIVSAEGPI